MAGWLFPVLTLELWAVIGLAMAGPPRKSHPRAETVCACLFATAGCTLTCALALGLDHPASAALAVLLGSGAVGLWLMSPQQEDRDEGGDGGTYVDWEEFDRLRDRWRRDPRKPGGGGACPAPEEKICA